MAITTPALIQQYLGIGAIDAALLTTLAAAADAFVLSYIDRDDLMAKSYSEIYNGTGADILVPDHGPVNSITSLKINGKDIPASTGYGVPGYTNNRRYFALRGYKFERGRLNVEVTFNAGFATLPADIQQAATFVAAGMYKRRDRFGVSSKTIGQESISYSASDLSSDSKKILDSYKKVYLTT